MNGGGVLGAVGFPSTPAPAVPVTAKRSKMEALRGRDTIGALKFEIKVLRKGNERSTEVVDAYTQLLK